MFKIVEFIIKIMSEFFTINYYLSISIIVNKYLIKIKKLIILRKSWQ